MSNCRSCNAPIRWATTTVGKAMPLDYSPDEAGNVVFTGRQVTKAGGGISPEVEVLGQAGMLPDERVRFMPHHATCPDADAWRRGA